MAERTAWYIARRLCLVLPATVAGFMDATDHNLGFHEISLLRRAGFASFADTPSSAATTQAAPGLTGRKTVKATPWPRTLRHSTVPDRVSARLLTMESPRPVERFPPVALELRQVYFPIGDFWSSTLGPSRPSRRMAKPGRHRRKR